MVKRRKIKPEKSFPRKRKESLALLVLGIVLFLAIAIPLYLTGRPAFLKAYPALGGYYKSWQGSKHRNVSCPECHIGKKALTYRIALIGEFYRRIIGPPTKKPIMVSLEGASRESCFGCHKNERSLDMTRLLRVPHPAHIEVATEKRDCVKCHKWVAHKEEYQERHKSVVFTGICLAYECHSGTKSRQECPLCHHSQSFEEATWRQLHPQIVSPRGSNFCLDYCHEANQCRACHTTGVSPFLPPTPGPRPAAPLIAKHASPEWKAEHGGEALVDGNRCFFCHGSRDECKSCHTKFPASHEPRLTWLSRHQPLAKEDVRRCLTCHPQTKCDNCHRIFREIEDQKGTI